MRAARAGAGEVIQASAVSTAFTRPPPRPLVAYFVMSAAAVALVHAVRVLGAMVELRHGCGRPPRRPVEEERRAASQVMRTLEFLASVNLAATNIEELMGAGERKRDWGGGCAVRGVSFFLCAGGKNILPAQKKRCAPAVPALGRLHALIA